MDFIIDNYLWFIIGGVAIIMIIIGYFAEKTDFGRKPLRSEKKKEEVKEPEQVQTSVEPDVTELENIRINDVIEQQKDEEFVAPEESEPQDANNEETQSSDLIEELELPETDFDNQIEQSEPEADNAVEANIPEVIEDETTSSEDDVWNF